MECICKIKVDTTKNLRFYGVYFYLTDAEGEGPFFYLGHDSDL